MNALTKKIIAICLILLFVSGCGFGKNNAQNQNVNTDQNQVGSQDNTKSSVTAPDVKPEEEKNYTSVYTGEAITKESFDNIPFLAVIENMKSARPQSGLASADIVFETLAEGGIPRCMALFQSQSAEKIGPIRSDRVYFNELAESLGLPFAHCGGSQTALDEISARGLMSLNEMANGKYYWRDKARKKPHNLYTSSEKLVNLIKNKGYTKEPSFNLSFDDSYWGNIKDKASLVTLKMSGYYTTAYQYENGRYYKTMNNAKVPDKNTGEQLSAKNIIIQITRIVPIAGDEKKRVEVKLTGSGTGYAISNGSYVKIKWSKADETSPIVITDENGQDIKLSKGNTWWEIVDGYSKINIK